MRISDWSSDVCSSDLHDGEPLTMMKVLVHRPKVLRSMISIGGAPWGSGHVGPRERELALLRSVWRTGCEYEFGHHRQIGRATRRARACPYVQVSVVARSLNKKPRSNYRKTVA